MRASTILFSVRLAFALVSVAAGVLMLAKPLQGLEQVIGLDDKAAHAIAFYGLTIGLYLTLPDRRRGDLTVFVIVAALAVELLQGFTGRSVSAGDFIAGAAGATAAWAPGVIEQFRRRFRGEVDRRAASRARASAGVASAKALSKSAR